MVVFVTTGWPGAASTKKPGSPAVPKRVAGLRTNTELDSVMRPLRSLLT